MLRKKKKNKHQLPDEELNITSLMDILTTLLFFILMVMSFQDFSVMESTSLIAGSESDEKKPVFTLQLTVKSKRNVTIWLGPIKGLDTKMANRSKFMKFLSKRFKGRPSSGYTTYVRGKDQKDLLKKIQNILIGIKRGFPSELKSVVSFTDNISYQQMIDTLSAVRELPPSVGGFVYTNLINQKEKTSVLFPQVIIAEEDEGAS